MLNWVCIRLEREIKESRILYSDKRVIINNPFIISMVSNEMIAQISKQMNQMSCVSFKEMKKVGK